MTEAAAESARSGENSFSRKSASLIRGMGFFAVVAFGINCISLSSSGQMPFSTLAGLWPQGNLTMILLMAMLLSLFHAYTYAVIGSAAPRSGADYYVASRVLSAPLAFASSWVLVLVSGVVAGSLIASVPQSTLPMVFRTLGIISGNPQWITFANTVATPDMVALIGTIFVVLVFLTIILSQRFMLRLLQIGVVLGLIAWAIIYFQLLSVPANAFPGAWNSFMGPGDYLDRLIQARALGMSGNSFDLNSTTLAGMVLGFWVFYGYFIPTFFAGEVKEPAKNLLRGSLVSLLLAGSIFWISIYLVNRLIPSEWLAAQSYLYLNPQYRGISMPWITFYAAVVRPNIALVAIVGFAWVFTMFNLAQTYFFAVSRMVLAWAEDHLILDVAAFIHPTLRTPLLPVLFVSTIAEIGVIDAALNGALASQVHFVFFVALTQLLPVTAITLLPFLKRDWFANASPFVRLKIGPVPVISLVGLVTMAYLIWLVVASIIYPVFGGIQPGTLILSGILFVSGLAWFFGRQAFLKDRDTRFNVQPSKSSAD